MKHLLPYLLCLLFTVPIFAQNRPVILPEDIDPSTITLRCYCKPGVANKSKSRGLEIAYKFNGKSTIEEEKGTPLMAPYTIQKSLELFVFKLKAPLINKEAFKLLFGYGYSPEHYEFEQIGADFSNAFSRLQGQPLKTNSFSLIGLKSLNEYNYISARYKLGFNGDYDGWISTKERYAVHNFIGMYGVKKRDDLEWGVGFTFTHSFRRTIAIPIFQYNKNFNDKWGLEAVLPALIKIRHNLLPSTILLAGVEYNSRSYSIDIPGAGFPQGSNAIYDLNHSELLNAISIEQQLIPWIWVNVKAGYQYNFSTDFEAKHSELSSFKVEPEDSFFFMLGVFISPPSGD